MCYRPIWVKNKKKSLYGGEEEDRTWKVATTHIPRHEDSPTPKRKLLTTLRSVQLSLSNSCLLTSYCAYIVPTPGTQYTVCKWRAEEGGFTCWGGGGGKDSTWHGWGWKEYHCWYIQDGRWGGAYCIVSVLRTFLCFFWLKSMSKTSKAEYTTLITALILSLSAV